MNKKIQPKKSCRILWGLPDKHTKVFTAMNENNIGAVYGKK